MLYLCGITTSNKFDNLKELIDPILPYFNGLIWTYHGSETDNDEGRKYLEENKKLGKIVYATFKQRHGFSMSCYLNQGTLEEGDFFIQLDDQERLGVEFCATHIPDLMKKMNDNNIAMVANYNKGLLFRYNELLEFKGSPHWFATGLDGQSANLQLPENNFWSVRSRNRDKFQWVDHYMKYYLYPNGSNHALLGLDHHLQGNNFFQPREIKRLEFRRLMRERGYPLTVEGVKKMFEAEIDDKVKEYINFDLILNDFYRFYNLNDRTLIDNHHWNEMIKI